MIHPRRDFLKQLTGAGVAGAFGNRAFLGLTPLCAAESRVTPDIVRLDPEIEPLVRLIEETSRSKCFEMMVEQLRRGVPYRQFLAALFLAGIRNVNPQPPGFKFHCVFAIHSAHQLSLDAAVSERLLPLFWALDFFKGSQQRDVNEGDFRLQPVRGKLPPRERAWEEFHGAMEAWDEERADRAVVALARTRGAHEIIEEFWRYGARDFRNIGHKAIFVANSWRTLETIGWRHAEPTLRSLVLGLLDFGTKETVNGYAFEDQCYLPNLEQARKAAEKLPANWAEPEKEAENPNALEVLAAVRHGKTEEACQTAVLHLAKGKARASSLWDTVHLAAGELMMRRPGIYGVHTVTSVNALHYAFQVSSSPQTRLLMLLQGIGWMSQFADFMSKGSRLGETRITEVKGAEIESEPGKAAEEILALLSSDPAAAARKAFTYAEQHPQPDELAGAARSLIFRKGTDAHDYKYAAAILEDYSVVSPNWRPHMLATAVYNLRGSGHPDSKVMERARDAVGALG